MTDDDHKVTLGKALSSIESIAMMLRTVGKRSQLNIASKDIIEEARRHADALEKEIISLKYEYPAQRFERSTGGKAGLK